MTGLALLVAASEDFDHVGGGIGVLLQYGCSCLGCSSGCDLMD